MDDDKIKQLFAAYNPELPSDTQFMERLQRKLQAVEFLKKKTAERRRLNHLAVIIATFVGFISGVSFTLCYPYLKGIITDIAGMNTLLTAFAAGYSDTVIWALTAVVTATLSFTAYDVTLFAARAKR